MRKQLPYTTPQGYFDDLKVRLARIPAVAQATESEQPAPAQEKHRPFVVRMLPYVALAASFVLAAVIGNFVLSRTARPAVSSEEEIIQYLIDSGTTVAQIEDYLSYNYNTIEP